MIKCLKVDLDWKKQYRLIPSHYPIIDLFESVASKDDFEKVYAIESLTNPRLSEIKSHLVSSEDWIDSSVVMAAFTHLGKTSRFSNGNYGVYYASKEEETAIRETIYHREVFLANTNEDSIEITMRVYVGEIKKPFHDIRNPKNKKFIGLHHKENYQPSQQFGVDYRNKKSWGIVYRSVRHEGGECIAVLRPPAISKPRQSKHYVYVWNGKKITDYYMKSLPTALY